MKSNCMGAPACRDAPSLKCCSTLHGARPCWLQSRHAVRTRRARCQMQVLSDTTCCSGLDIETSPGWRPARRRILSTIATAAGTILDQQATVQPCHTASPALSEVLHRCRLVLGDDGSGSNVSAAMGTCSPKWCKSSQADQARACSGFHKVGLRCALAAGGERKNFAVFLSARFGGEHCAQPFQCSCWVTPVVVQGLSARDLQKEIYQLKDSKQRVHVSSMCMKPIIEDNPLMTCRQCNRRVSLLSADIRRRAASCARPVRLQRRPVQSGLCTTPCAPQLVSVPCDVQVEQTDNTPCNIQVFFNFVYYILWKVTAF
jgi:hypothetical protein